MKLLGTVFVILSCTALGIMKARSLARENEAYAELISALTLMKGEICSRASSMDEVFRLLNTEKRSCTSAFFSKICRDMSDIGNISLKAIWQQAADTLCISSDGVQAVKALGNVLGRYDAQAQSAAIERCMLALSAEQNALREKLNENKRMYIGIGAASGLVLAILLI